MTALNPPGFMQARTDHSALTHRRNTMLLMDGTLQAATVARGGCHGAYGSVLGVTGSGSVMQVTVGTGMAGIAHGSAFGGLYSVVNDANVTLSVGAAHATQFRRDLVIAEILDTTDGDGSDLWQLRVVAGANSVSSPAPLPTQPTKSELLAIVNVDPAITNLTGKVIDSRRVLPTIGGTMLGITAQRPAHARVGMLYTNNESRKAVEYWDGSGWRFIADNAWTSYTPAVTGFGTGTFTVRLGRWKLLAEKALAVQVNVTMNATGTDATDVTIGLPFTPARTIDQICSVHWSDSALSTIWSGIAKVRTSGSGAKFDVIRLPLQMDGELDDWQGQNMTAGSSLQVGGIVELA